MPKSKKVIAETQKELKESGVPLCFDSQHQWDLWREQAKASKLKNRSSYCTDCTADYKLKMIAQQRCRYPETSFRLDVHGFIEGRRSYDTGE